MKVAIVGLAEERDDPPWNEWECWCLLGDEEALGRADAFFEMHHDMAEQGYLDIAARVPQTPVYWQFPTQGNLIEYPLQDVVADLGRDWFDSSLAYMMGLAIHKGAETIGLFRAHDATSEEYAFQRDNLHWLIGLAEGRGIEVRLSPNSLLCRPVDGRYGFA